MNAQNLLTYFLTEIPELESDIKKQCNENLIDEQDGNYVIWGIGIMPCILKLLENFESNKQILKRVFDFFEKMANEDNEVKEILLHSILEDLGDDKKIISVAEPLLGPKTLICLQKVNNFFGR